MILRTVAKCAKAANTRITHFFENGTQCITSHEPSGKKPTLCESYFKVHVNNLCASSQEIIYIHHSFGTIMLIFASSD